MSTRLRLCALAGALLIAFPLALPSPASASAAAADASAATASATTGGVAWTVQTADNAQGTGRGNFAYDVAPGAVISDAMIVVNTGTEPLPLSVYAADAFTASTGEIDVLVDGQPSQDAGTWVTVSPTTLTLNPGDAADLPFTIAVPADARPGDHAAGIVTSFTSADAASTLSVDRRLGTRINLRVSGELTPAATIADVSTQYVPSWNPFDSGRLVVQYALTNTGNTRLTGSETIATTSLVGGRTAPAQMSEILPGSTVQVEREVPVFSLGWITGAVAVTPEGVGLGAALLSPVSTDFSTAAVPWSLYVLLVLILGIALGAVLTVRRVRRRRGAETE